MADSPSTLGNEKPEESDSHESLSTEEIGSSDGNDAKGSDEVFEMKCESCKKDGKFVTAAAFCTSCMAYFCSSCLKYHEKFLQDHICLEGDNIPQDVCIEKCKEHKNEFIKFYCVSCQTVACHVCKTRGHKRDCTLTYLPDYVKDQKNDEELKDLVYSSNSLGTQLEEIQKVMIKKHEEIINITKEVNYAIEIEKKSLFGELDQEALIIEEKVQSAKGTERQRVDTMAEIFESLKSETDQLTTHINQLQESPKSVTYKAFIEIKEKQHLLKDLESNVQDLKKDFSSRHDAFKNEISSQAEDLKARVKMFGKEIKNKAGEEKKARKIANFLEDIYVRDPDDENDVAIFDICLLSEQYIIVCDRSNCTVKLVDKKKPKNC